MTERELLRKQWQAVAQVLQIEFAGPFIFTHQTVVHEFACLLPQFGGGLGMLIDSEYTADAYSAASRAGYTCSSMRADRQDVPVDSTDYIETLVDWGWSCTIHQPPEWYRLAKTKHSR